MITFRLSEERDADLIAFVQSIPKYQRAIVYRAALRHYRDTVYHTSRPSVQISIAPQVPAEVPADIDLDSRLDDCLSSF